MREFFFLEMKELALRRCEPEKQQKTKNVCGALFSDGLLSALLRRGYPVSYILWVAVQVLGHWTRPREQETAVSYILEWSSFETFFLQF